MLSVEGLDVSIGATPVLRGVTLEVPAASMCGLIGRNGAGKTTLMLAIMGALPASGGTARFEHRDLAKVPGHHRARLGIGYMPEDRRLVPALTAEENIMLPVWSTGLADAQQRLDWIYGLMPEVAEFRRRGATQLSGGQQAGARQGGDEVANSGALEAHGYFSSSSVGASLRYVMLQINLLLKIK
jgi:branched-chain amino acid transport system ATP-binding protein